ncbi:putative inactive UDP-arabinopyranose mutase 2 [Wolffia australiana]
MFPEVDPGEVDVVVVALEPDLTAFIDEWQPFISRFRVLIIQDPNLGAHKSLRVPPGLNHKIYTAADARGLLGNAAFAVSHVGYLVSDKRIVVILDSSCRPHRSSGSGDPVAQHLTNLLTPATPSYFNTLYDPYRSGVDFVRGYPFSLRGGVHCVLSSGLSEGQFVDAVITVPAGAMMVVPAVNIACDRRALGPALLPPFHVEAPLAEIWAGLCGKLVADHLGLGVKSGLPYVARSCTDIGPSSAVVSAAEAERAALEFFRTARLPRTAVVAADCVRLLAELVRERLGGVHPGFSLLADAMLAWLDFWNAVELSR